MIPENTPSQITISTPNLLASIGFYEKLGYRLIAKEEEPNAWAYMTDESLLILLSQDEQSFFGLTYFNPDLDGLLEELEKNGITPAGKQNDTEGTRFAFLLSPDNFGVALVRHSGEGIFRPTGKTFKDYPQEDLENPEKYPNPIMGLFGEFCQPVKDFKTSQAWWKALGFNVLSENEGPYTYGILTHGQHIIGLHQTEEFKQPALTYFAKDSAKKIAHLREQGIDSISQFEGTGGDEKNVVITSPEQQHVFLFNF